MPGGDGLNTRARRVAAALIALAVVAGAAVLLLEGAPDDTGEAVRRTESGSQEAANASPGAPDDDPAVAANDDSDAAVAPVATTAARSRARSVRDTPRPPKSATPSPAAPATPNPAKPSDPGSDDPSDELTDEQREYLEETRAIVERDPAALREMAGAIVAAITSGDEDALAEHLADDEGPQPEYLAALLDRYPTIVESAPLGTVNIFSAGEATLYFAYALVEWEDAGIRSEHTIPVPMRYVNGEWRLTTLDDPMVELTFVQAVQL